MGIVYDSFPIIGYVYRISNKKLNIAYVGSTTNSVYHRWLIHLYAAKSDNAPDCAISCYLREHNIRDFEIDILGEYKIVDLLHLRMYEQLWMNKTKNLINKNRPFFIKRVDKQSNKWKENIRKQKKSYYQSHRDTLRAKVQCECGSSYTKSNKSNHMSTNKHLKFLNPNYVGIDNRDLTNKIHCDCGGLYTRTGKPSHLMTKKHTKYVNGLSPQAKTEATKA